MPMENSIFNEYMMNNIHTKVSVMPKSNYGSVQFKVNL